MPLRWIAKPTPPQSPSAPEAPQIVLAAPGSIAPGRAAARRWLLPALAASMVLAACQPQPGPNGKSFVVINLNPSGAGSLQQALSNANTNPGPDIITFQAGLTGVIPLTSQLSIADAVQIQGPGPGLLSVSGSNVTRVFYISSTALFTATISGLTIRDGSALKGSGGIWDKGENLILDNVAVVSNTTSMGRGGGVSVINGGPNQGGLTVRNSIISGNHATRGGGIFTIATPEALLIQKTQIVSNTAADKGGGIFFYKPAGDITIEDSTIAGNSAVNDGGGLSIYNTTGGQHVIRRTTISGNTAADGAGLQLYGVHNPLLIENSTVAGNRASASGGGLFLYGAVTLRDNTIVGNTAQVAGGGIFVNNGTLPITDTIIAGNRAPLAADITGTVQLSYDLVQVTGTARLVDNGGNLFGLDPLLGPLADNGGPTQTYLPGPTSPALNAGDPAFAAPPATDQRGAPRPAGGRVDIGAVEGATSTK